MDLEDRGFEETVREKSRTDLYNYIKQSSGRLLDDKFAYMKDCVIRETNCPTEKISSLKKELKLFKWQFRHGWYPMTPTLHKLLVHGPTIIKHAIIPIGQLSEEAAEARNKHFRQYRTDFARKFSKISCNVDVLNRLLLSSDPLLSCTRSRFMKNKKPFTKEALEFLIPESDDSEDTGAQYTTTIDD
ncbi:unnamed protein product [Leptosia nina]|uniref:Uncharacterized protein n=1 Tax=Leptosia nina TaxID=320188 RepID=A0AAV1JLI0_9NEOP